MSRDTAEGYELLSAELERLRSHGRRELSERLYQARHDGHLSDNRALSDAFEAQAQLEAGAGARRASWLALEILRVGSSRLRQAA